MEIVRAVGLKKYYITETYEVRALDDVSLSITDGEFLAVVGTSGSGKTTLLNMLGGLDVPTEGGVWIRGNSLKDMEPEERTIFRRFYRGKRVTSQEGFGLGLYLAREIVNMHGGFLVVKRMEPGLMMEVDLPVGLS